MVIGKVVREKGPSAKACRIETVNGSSAEHLGFWQLMWLMATTSANCRLCFRISSGRASCAKLQPACAFLTTNQIITLSLVQLQLSEGAAKLCLAQR